jgi:Uncharacterised protein family (UPF0149)
MAMNTFPKEGRLTEAELDQLAEFLRKSRSGHAMNIEEPDGFFAALIAGPEVVLPSEYLPEVLGDCQFAGLDRPTIFGGRRCGTGMG